MLRDVLRHSDALRAYKEAGAQPNSEIGRDQLNLLLAHAGFGLCNVKNAQYRLRTYIEWNPSDPRANLLGCTIARYNGNWPEAEHYLSRLESGGAETRMVGLDQRYQLLKDQGSDDAAHLLIRETVARSEADPSVLNWCALRAVEEHDFEYARGVWESVALKNPDLAAPQIGLMHAYYQSGRRAASTEEQRALFVKSVQAGRRAIEIDPSNYQAYWNICLPLWRARLTERGSEADLTEDDWRALLDHANQSLRYYGLQPDALSAGAYAHMRLFERDNDPSHVVDGIALVRRAIRSAKRQAQGGCSLTDQNRQDISDYYDTLRELQELSGNIDGALSAARTALDVLDAGDPDVAKRREHAVRLEALVGTNR